MDKKGVRTIWNGIASAFLLTGIFADKPNVFITIGLCFVFVGNMRSRIP